MSGCEYGGWYLLNNAFRVRNVSLHSLEHIHTNEPMLANTELQKVGSTVLDIVCPILLTSEHVEEGIRRGQLIGSGRRGCLEAVEDRQLRLHRGQWKREQIRGYTEEKRVKR